MWIGISLFLLAFAVSLDSFGAGITYGLRKIRLPLLSILIIAFCSGVMILLSMQVGRRVADWLSPAAANVTGAVILLVIGMWAIWNGRKRPFETADPDRPSGEEPKMRVFSLEIRTLGLVIQILKTPAAADMDRSGTINTPEAFLLGTALSLDAFGAGLGAAFLGYSPWFAAVMIAGMSSLFLVGGMRLGFRYSRIESVRSISCLPGVLLVAIGLFRILTG